MNTMATERTNFIRRMYSRGHKVSEIFPMLEKEGFAPVTKQRMHSIVRTTLAQAAHKQSRAVAKALADSRA